MHPFSFAIESRSLKYTTQFIQPQIVGIGELYNMDSLHIVCEGSIVVNLPQLRIIDAAVVLLATFYLYKIDYKEAKAILCFLVRISWNKIRQPSRMQIYFAQQIFILILVLHGASNLQRNIFTLSLIWLVENDVFISDTITSRDHLNNMAEAEMSSVMSSENTGAEDVEIVLDKNLSEETKLELIKELRNYPCLWQTTNTAYKNKQTRAKST